MQSIIYVPFTTIPTDTLIALAPHASRVVAVRMRDDRDYGRLLQRVWSHHQDFMVIEHDILPHAGVVPVFDACPEPWCVFPYANTDRYAGHLGCVRFRSELMRWLPDAIDAARDIRHPALHAGHWLYLDSAIARVLEDAGYRRHTHTPPVGHTNPRQQIATELERGYCHYPARVWPERP